MSKLVLGIIAVGLLQVAFVAYTHLEQPLTVAMLPEQPEAGAEVVPSLIPETPVSRSTNDTEPAVTPTKARFSREETSDSRDQVLASRTSTNSRAVDAGRVAAFDRERTARPGDFSTVVISYSGNRAESPACDIPSAPKPKNRSLMAKAAPVVKKPWEFIKAIGSKLN